MRTTEAVCRESATEPLPGPSTRPRRWAINFHEVRAKSGLNHVPGGRFGFNWTVNAFRGCTHACVYCTGPATEVLKADGRTAPIAHLRPGDQICGTVGAGLGDSW